MPEARGRLAALFRGCATWPNADARTVTGTDVKGTTRLLVDQITDLVARTAFRAQAYPVLEAPVTVSTTGRTVLFRDIRIISPRIPLPPRVASRKFKTTPRSIGTLVRPLVAPPLPASLAREMACAAGSAGLPDMRCRQRAHYVAPPIPATRSPDRRYLAATSRAWRPARRITPASEFRLACGPRPAGP